MTQTVLTEKKPFTCRRCKKPVAETDGASIFFGPKPVPMNPTRIKFICPFCKCEVEWIKVRNQICVA